MTTLVERRVRLSSYVVFVDYGAEVELQHTVRGTACRTDRATYEDLLQFRTFREPADRHVRWVETGVLVPPFLDRPAYHGGLEPGTEAALARDYQDWYWRHEVESEREHRWLGRNIGKMPSDLFLYQELMSEHGIDSVLEIGYGDGGGLWFFGTMLRLLGGGTVVGVDWDGGIDLQAFRKLDGVRVDLVEGDAHAANTLKAVRAVRPRGFGLVVIDADPEPSGKVRLLERWCNVVAPGGHLIVEDVESPRCRDAEETIRRGCDQFLLDHDAFRVELTAARAPLLKARGAVFYREQSAP